MEAMVVSSGSLNVLEYAILNNIKQTLIQMKSFDEFISEKFDYTKQKQLKQNDFKNLKPGDNFYVLFNKGKSINTESVKDITIENNIINVARVNGMRVKFDLNFCYEDLGLMLFSSDEFPFVASTKIENIVKFKAKYAKKYANLVANNNDSKEELFKLIKDFYEN